MDYIRKVHTTFRVDGLYLHHVEFLGAAAPAVQGLKSVELAGFDGAGDENDWLAFGERLSQSALVKHYEWQIRPKHFQKKLTDFFGSEMRQINMLQRFGVSLRRRNAVVESERDVDRLIAGGKVLPRDKDGLLAFMLLLDKSTMIAFADGEAERTMADWFMGFLQAQMPQVTYGAMDLGPDPSEGQTAQFAAPEGHDIDHTALALHAEATQIMRDKGVSFEAALELVHGD